MDVLGSTGWLELGLFRTQMDEERQVRALASGLRVISASDDPSGLAISENIQSQVLGLQQGVQNVQTANNLLDVADATLANVQSILEKVHSLVVQASNDFNSEGDLEMIQDEIDSLLKQVNKIASDAKFNGVTLFDGSLSGYTSNMPSVAQVTSLPFPDGSAPTGTQVVNYDGISALPGNLVWSDISSDPSTLPTVDPTNSLTSAFVTVRVTGYSDNAVDPDSGTAVGPGDYLQIVVYSTDPNLGQGQEYTDTAAVPVNGGEIYPVQVIAPGGPYDIINFTIANLTAADVGTSMSFETSAPNQTVTGTSGTPLTINSTGTEGGDVRIALPNLSTSALNLSGISVTDTTVVDFFNNVTGEDTNQFATADAQARLEAAIDAVSEARATLGAQAVSLREDANDSSLEVVNLIASESAIRDVDIGQAATQFTKDQVISQIGISVMAQMQANAQLVIQLVDNVNPGVSGKV